VIDVYLSETRDTAATAFFEQAIARTDVRPHRVTTDKAPTYPTALRAVVPEAEHITGKMEQQGIERDHQHLKGCTRSMRGFQQLRCARIVCDGTASCATCVMGSTGWVSQPAIRVCRTPRA